MDAVSLTAHGSWELLAEQSQKFQPRFAALSDATLTSVVDRAAFWPETELVVRC